MLIANFTVDHPILRETLTTVSGTEIQWEHSFKPPERTGRTLGWVTTSDFEDFAAAARSDPTVSDPTSLTDLDGRRLYRFDIAETVEEYRLYPQIVDVGGVFRRFVGTADGWAFSVGFPDRGGLRAIHEFCQENDLEFTLKQIFDEAARARDETATLTDPQRDILLAAVESGYLDIPRETTLAELGNRLDISESAASERFRRGTKALIEATLQSGPE